MKPGFWPRALDSKPESRPGLLEFPLRPCENPTILPLLSRSTRKRDSNQRLWARAAFRSPAAGIGRGGDVSAWPVDDGGLLATQPRGAGHPSAARIAAVYVHLAVRYALSVLRNDDVVGARRARALAARGGVERGRGRVGGGGDAGRAVAADLGGARRLVDRRAQRPRVGRLRGRRRGDYAHRLDLPLARRLGFVQKETAWIGSFLALVTVCSRWLRRWPWRPRSSAASSC